MPDRKYTYQVEIDASQAQQQAAQLRAIFAKELGEVLGGTQASSQSAGQRMAADLQKASKPLEEIKREMESLAKVDPSTPIDQLLTDLGTLDRALADTRQRIEETFSPAFAGKTKQEIADFKEYVERVRNSAGEEAAQTRLRTGRYLNQKDRYAEFPTDDPGPYFEDEKDYFASQRDAVRKHKESLDAKLEAAKLDAEYYETEYQINQRQQEITRRQIAELDQRLGAATGPVDVSIFEQMEFAEQQARELGDQEAELLQKIAGANEQIINITEQQQARIQAEQDKAARRSGDLAALSDVSGAAKQVRTNITVTGESAENIERMAAGLKASVDLSEKLATNTREIARARADEYQADAASYKVKQDARSLADEKIKQAEKELEATKAAGRAEVLRAETAKSAQAAITAAERAAATEKQNLSKQTTAMIIGEENRRTIAAKKELAEQNQAFKEANAQRTAAMRSSARAGTGGGVGSALSMIGLSPQMLIGGMAASLGLYSVDQIGRNVYEAGRSGAQMERMATTFEQVARRVGVSSDAMIASIKAASRETITNTEAMSLGAQILAQKWSSSSEDLIGDTGRLVEASRRLSQIYTDESGKFLTTQEVFARLLKYIREGNKELVDQFGISNARIAEALGISKDGLAAAGGAADRFRGLIKVLGEDMERLGPAMLTTADKFEQAETRIVQSKDRIRKALATPVANAIEGFSYGVENALIGTDFDITKNVVTRTAAANPQNQAYKELVNTYENLAALAEKNSDAAAKFESRMTPLATAIASVGFATREQYNELNTLNRAIELAATGQDAQARAMAITTEAGIKQNTTIRSIVIAMQDYENQYTAGKIGLAEYTGLINNLAAALSTAATNAGMLSPALAGVNAQLGQAGANPIAYTGAAGSASWFTLRQQQDSERQDRIDAQTARDQAARAEAKRVADAQAKEYEAAAKKAADAFEQAARDAAGSFKDQLEKIPGLFGTSEVTENDLALAEAGMYEEKPDEYLRRLREEVRDNIDKYGDVDIRDAAARIGLDPNLDPKAILAKFEQKWADSSLFAGGANIDLINQSAVQRALDQQDASASGREALLKYFGLDNPETALTDPAQKTAFADLIGLSDGAAYDAGQAAQVEFVQGFSTPAADGGGQTPDFLAPIVQSMEGSANTSDISNRLAALGGSLFGRIFTGFETAATAADWGKPLISSLAASVAPEVFDMLAGALNKPPQ